MSTQTPTSTPFHRPCSTQKALPKRPRTAAAIFRPPSTEASELAHGLDRTHARFAALPPQQETQRNLHLRCCHGDHEDAAGA